MSISHSCTSNSVDKLLVIYTVETKIKLTRRITCFFYTIQTLHFYVTESKMHTYSTVYLKVLQFRIGIL
jgi:hypothetical protein